MRLVFGSLLVLLLLLGCDALFPFAAAVPGDAAIDIAADSARADGPGDAAAGDRVTVDAPAADGTVDASVADSTIDAPAADSTVDASVDGPSTGPCAAGTQAVSITGWSQMVVCEAAVAVDQCAAAEPLRKLESLHGLQLHRPRWRPARLSDQRLAAGVRPRGRRLQVLESERRDLLRRLCLPAGRRGRGRLGLHGRRVRAGGGQRRQCRRGHRPELPADRARPQRQRRILADPFDLPVDRRRGLLRALSRDLGARAAAA